MMNALEFASYRVNGIAQGYTLDAMLRFTYKDDADNDQHLFRIVDDHSCWRIAFNVTVKMREFTVQSVRFNNIIMESLMERDVFVNSIDNYVGGVIYDDKTIVQVVIEENWDVDTSSQWIATMWQKSKKRDEYFQRSVNAILNSDSRIAFSNIQKTKSYIDLAYKSGVKFNRQVYTQAMDELKYLPFLHMEELNKIMKERLEYVTSLDSI